MTAKAGAINATRFDGRVLGVSLLDGLGRKQSLSGSSNKDGLAGSVSTSRRSPAEGERPTAGSDEDGNHPSVGTAP